MLLHVLIIFQVRPLVLIICMLISILTILTAISILIMVYPKVVLTVVFIMTVVYILTVVSSLSDKTTVTPHFYFHVIAYPAVRVKCKYSQKLCTNKLTHYFPKRKAVAASQVRNHCRNSENDSFGKGFCRTRSSTAS